MSITICVLWYGVFLIHMISITQELRIRYNNLSNNLHVRYLTPIQFLFQTFKMSVIKEKRDITKKLHFKNFDRTELWIEQGLLINNFINHRQERENKISVQYISHEISSRALAKAFISICFLFYFLPAFSFGTFPNCMLIGNIKDLSKIWYFVQSATCWVKWQALWILYLATNKYK